MTFAILSGIIQNDNKSNGGFVLSSLKEYKDEELVKLFAAGDGPAGEELILRYSHYVRSLTRPYFLAGGDSEDLIQEGMKQYPALKHPARQALSLLRHCASGQGYFPQSAIQTEGRILRSIIMFPSANRQIR